MDRNTSNPDWSWELGVVGDLFLAKALTFRNNGRISFTRNTQLLTKNGRPFLLIWGFRMNFVFLNVGKCL